MHKNARVTLLHTRVMQQRHRRSASDTHRRLDPTDDGQHYTDQTDDPDDGISQAGNGGRVDIDVEQAANNHGDQREKGTDDRPGLVPGLILFRKVSHS